MKDTVVFLLLAIFGFLLWNQTQIAETYTDVSAEKSVSPSTIQSIINTIQAKNPDVYPIQTVYINPLVGDKGATIYNARIMFLNTRGYFGVQYDIQADENGNIISMSEQPMSSEDTIFQPFGTKETYMSFEDTQAALDKQFADLKTQVPGYQSKLDTWLETMRSANISNANAAASIGAVVSAR
jgi:hypothetical protein